MRAFIAILTLTLSVFAGALFAGSTIQIVPTTTVATETANNTGAADTFATQSNGNPAPGNTSKLPLRGLLYSGSTTKIYAHFMPWFGGSNHMWVGYHSDDPAQVNKQVNDMMSRGYDGAIVDWYGPNHPRENNTTLYLRDNAETRNGTFVFAVMEDVGALTTCANTTGCSVTQQVISDLNYVASTYYPSPAYMYIGGRPVLFFFGLERYTIDWNAVRAGVNGNPLFIFRNSGGFTKPQTNGAFSWIGISSTTTTPGMGYLDNFYSTALKYPTEQTFGSFYAGFNDTLASWGSNRIVDRQCGQTWLTSLAESGRYYSTSRQLASLQTVTWNDYEEGSEVETGIDGCLGLTAGMNGSVLSWNLTGSASVVDHYNIFISTDGVNLMKLASATTAQASLDLSSFALAAGSYTLYVQAYAKPSIHNVLSGAVSYTLAGKPPVVTLALDTATGVAPQTVNATVTATDATSTVTSTTINFGDGGVPASGTSAAHSYTAAGTYTVTATATDNAGMSASATQLVTIAANLPPVASLSVSPGSGIAPLAVTASTAASTDPDGSIASSSIDFGDGTVLAGPTAAHTYSTTGTKTITATVTDNKGASNSTTATVTVNANRPPVAALSVTPASGTAPVTVTASTSASYDPDGTVASSKIDFGDGTVVAGPTASHTYSTAGTKTITATVTDNLGASSSTTSSVVVTAANQPPVAALSVSPATGVAALTVSASTSSSYDSDGSIASSKIAWGDGSTTLGGSGSHVYTKVGTYTVTATVTDNSGASTSTTQTVNATAGVKVSSPLNGAAYSTTSIKVTASAISSYPITTMRVYVDNVNRYSVSAASINTYVTMTKGTHSVVVQAWDSSGKVSKSSLTMTVK